VPFSYVCQNPACKQVFETVVGNSRCTACHFGSLKPQMTGEGPVDTFPGPGAPLNAAVVRSSNLAGPGTYRYSITDGTDRGLTIDVRNNGRDKVVSVDGSKVVQNIAGAVSEWIILNPNNQPDWGHFGTTALQAAIRAQDRTPPPSKPIYLRLGFQHATNLHIGFGFVHILFSHNRQAYSAVAEDLGHLIAAAEMRELFYTCKAHKQVHLSPAKFKAQDGKCIQRAQRGQPCGATLVPKHVARVFKSMAGAGNRYVLTREAVGTGEVLLAIFEDRDTTYNLVTMYTCTREQLSQKAISGEFSLLYPKSFR
jgi:hypothetical protein